MDKVLTIHMSFSACTSPRHMLDAFNTPDCVRFSPLVWGYSLVYLFEAPRPLNP